MYAVLDYLILAALVLAVVHAVLPREPLLRRAQGRLSLRPPLAGLVGESTIPLALLLAAAYLFALLLSARVLSGAVLAALVMSGLGLRVWWKWRNASVVFDRSTDCIRHGSLHVAHASQAAGVQVTGDRAPALELFLKDADGAPTYWVVPGVDDRHAPTVGRAIAQYLQVPLVTRVA